MAEDLAITRLLADRINISILLLLRTQPLHCRKLSAILRRSESQIARRLSQLEKASLVKGQWVHRGRNIKVYSLETDQIQIHITGEGIRVEYTPEKSEKLYDLESIFRFDVPPPDTFIDRESELSVLDSSFFATITGIAGIGKTSLASYYASILKSRGIKVFWHTFSDLDSVMFLVKKLAIFLAKYNFPQLLDYVKAEGSDQQVIQALLKESMKSSEFAFFFDDYHVVASESMNSLFNQLKKCDAKICVISRYRPPFVSVFDEVAEVQLEEMGINAVRKLLKMKGVELHRPALEQVSAKIGGHPLALEFLCQAAAASDPVSIVEKMPSLEIGNYLWDEIYSRLDPDEQQLLITVAIFRNPVTIEALKIICSFSHIHTVIKQLTRKNLLKNLDGTYTHHSVTRMFCLHLASDVEDLHVRAAQFYLEQETPQDTMEALYHLLEGNAHRKAVEVVLDSYELLINEGYTDSLFRFLEKIEDLPEFRLSLLEVEGVIHRLRGDYDQALHCFTTWLSESPAPVPASLYRNLGETYEKRREYKTAESVFLQGLRTAQDTVEKGNILVKLAAVYSALGEPERALSSCDEALNCFSVTEDKKGISHVYSQMGRIYRFSDTDKALKVLSTGLHISEEIGDMLEAASTYATMGAILYERGQTDEAVVHFEKSLKISEQIGNMVGIARCSNNIGVKYALEWKWPHAMEYYHRTLSICEQINDKKGIAFSYSNLGRAFSCLGLLDKALEYFFASLQLREELSDKTEIAYLYYQIGLTHQKSGNLDEALQWFEKSVDLRRKVGHTLGVAHCYASMGKVYGAQGEYDKGLELLHEALKVHQQEKSAWMIACTELFRAEIFIYKKESKRAAELAENTVPVFEKVGDKELLVSALQTAAHAYLELGITDQALFYAKQSLEQACIMGSPEFEGRARRILGTVYTCTGDLERAEEELQLSMRLLKKYVVELGRTYVQVALLCKKKGSPDEKYQYLLQKALWIFNEVGSKNDEVQCRQYLHST